MNKIDIIKNFLAEGSLPQLHKDKDYTIQEYMKLKQDSLYRIAEALEKKK